MEPKFTPQENRAFLSAFSLFGSSAVALLIYAASMETPNKCILFKKIQVHMWIEVKNESTCQ